MTDELLAKMTAARNDVRLAEDKLKAASPGGWFHDDLAAKFDPEIRDAGCSAILPILESRLRKARKEFARL